MQGQDFGFEHEQRGDFSLVTVEGSIIRSNHESFRGRMEAIANTDTKGIGLNLEGVDYMDSSGLGCLAAVPKMLAKRPFVVYGANRRLERMLKLIGLDTIIPLLPGESEALAHLRDRAQ